MKRNRTLFLGLFFIPLMLLALLTFLLPAKPFSANENRPLSQMPVLSASNLKAGSAQSDLSDFLSDQVPFRDFWLGVNTAIKKATWRTEINDIYLGDEHYYFQQFTDESFSVTRMEAFFQMMDEFIREQNIPATVMLVPSPGTVLSEKLPANAPYYDAQTVFEAAEDSLSGSVVDLRSIFSAAKNNTQLYYRTDHHWTSHAAYLAYQEYCTTVGLQPTSYTLKQASDDFYGTLYSKVLDIAAQPDSIYAPADLPEVKVEYEDGTITDSPFHQDKLSEKDQYTYFFGGNYGMVKIKTQAQTEEKLLIIKDSFANCFVPYLLMDYNEIIMLDLRYFGGSVQEVIQQNDVSQILFLYEMSNLLTDTGILRLQK